jgi:hypothetical protein
MTSLWTWDDGLWVWLAGIFMEVRVTTNEARWSQRGLALSLPVRGWQADVAARATCPVAGLYPRHHCFIRVASPGW